MSRKAQISLEQLLIAALGIAFITLIFYFSINYSNDSVRVSQAQDTVNKLSKSADYAYSLGPGTKDQIEVFLPEGIEAFNISDDRIYIKLSLTSGSTEIYAHTDAPLLGEITSRPGPRKISILATESGKVMFGESALSCKPESMAINIPQGGSGNLTFNVKNVGDFRIGGIGAILSGNIGDMASLVDPAAELDEAQSSSGLVSFEVPLEKETGGYTGMVTVTGGNCTGEGVVCECSSIVTVFVTRIGGVDTEGPEVEGMEVLPEYPKLDSSISVEARGSDEGFGNSTISLCQAELDYSGIWNDMVADDGAYDSVEEDVWHLFGVLIDGEHSVRVRCMDSELNMGPPSEVNFSIQAKKDILFITVDPVPSASESLWISWIDNGFSGEGFDWSHEVCSIENITSGIIDPYDYEVVVMADAPSTNPDFYSAMNDYKNADRYVILLGESMVYGVDNLGVGQGSGTYVMDNQSLMSENHYVNVGFLLGSVQNISDANTHLYYHSSFNGVNAISAGNNPSRALVFNAPNVISFGASRPDHLNSNGDLFARRVIDYALLNGVVSGDYTGPRVKFQTHLPSRPDEHTRINVTATADDAATGGNVVTLCQVRVDGGAWVDMNVTDGAYDSSVENIWSDIGTLSAGAIHNVYMKCQDSENNWGETSVESFGVTGVMLFMTSGLGPDWEDEALWVEWIDGHSSNEGYEWTYTLESANDVAAGHVDLSLFKMVMLSKYNTGSGVGEDLLDYMGDGGCVVMVDEALVYGPMDVGYASTPGSSRSGFLFWGPEEIDIYNNTHYITEGFSSTIKVQEYFIFNPIYYNSESGFSAVKLGANDGYASEIVLGLSGPSENLVTWGLWPALLTGNGDEISTRAIDYCIMTSDTG